MRHLFLAMGCAALMVAACGRQRGAEAPVVLTGAELEPETPDPTMRAFAERLAGEICEHEKRCGRDTALSECRQLVDARAGDALLDRKCPPAARRARVEECLATIRTEPCLVQLSHYPSPICALNDDCPSVADQLIAPGPSLAEIWRPER